MRLGSTGRRFSHPVAFLPDSAVVISGGGIIESLSSFGPDGVLCSDFQLQARVGTRVSVYNGCRIELDP